MVQRADTVCLSVGDQVRVVGDLLGVDHAGIATQVVVERLLASEGTNRLQLGREGFEQKIWEWVTEYGQRINNQLKKLGTSCDWTRSRFTLDDGPRKAVRQTFVDLYKEGLIYRDNRLVVVRDKVLAGGRYELMHYGAATHFQDAGAGLDRSIVRHQPALVYRAIGRRGNVGIPRARGASWS